MAKSRKRKPSFDPAPPAGDSQTGWVYRSDQTESPRPASKRQRTGSKGGGHRPPAAGPAVVPAEVLAAVEVAAPARGALETGVDWLSQPFAFALVAVLVPLSLFKGRV